MGEYLRGQQGQTVNLLLRLRRFESALSHHGLFYSCIDCRGISQPFSEKGWHKWGYSVTGRASALQAEGYGFNSRLGRHLGK